jgi:hypothetical protein
MTAAAGIKSVTTVTTTANITTTTAANTAATTAANTTVATTANTTVTAAADTTVTAADTATTTIAGTGKKDITKKSTARTKEKQSVSTTVTIESKYSEFRPGSYNGCPDL